jgi:hypothetical protein
VFLERKPGEEKKKKRKEGKIRKEKGVKGNKLKK